MKHRGENGQATVEFALIIPLVVVVLLAVIQVALVAYAQLGVAHVARETARAVSVDTSTDVSLLAQNMAPFGKNTLNIEVVILPAPPLGREFVVVTVSYQTPPISRLFAPFDTQMRVSAQIKMLVES